jgi:hypothetical protein
VRSQPSPLDPLSAREEAHRPARLDLFFPLLYLLLAGALWLAWGRTHEADANFIAYRFASNLHAGRALLYGTPAPAVSTYPLVPSLLALIALPGISLPTLGAVLSILATAVGAFSLSRLVNAGRWGGIAYVIAVAGLPSPVVLTMLALALAGLDAARQRRWMLSGVLIGLAILAEPSAILLAVLALILALRQGGSVWRYALPVIAIPGVIFLVVKFSLDPGGASLVSIIPGPLTVMLASLALVALARHFNTLRDAPYGAVLAAWSASLALLALLGGNLPNAAILPGLIALATLLSLRPLVVVAACADLVLSATLLNASVASPASIATGQWLAANSGPDATIASADIGAGAFYAGRTLIDTSRTLQPVAYDANFFLRYAPDVVVLRDTDPKPVWEHFATTYVIVHKEDGQTVYQRVINYSALDDHGVDVNYSASVGRSDLRLVNVAIGNVLYPGDLVRMRLDWELANTPLREFEVKLTLLNAQGLPIVGVRDKFPPNNWPAGKFSTYHFVMLPNDAPGGETSLYLGVSIHGAEPPDLRVAGVSTVRASAVR